MWFFAEIGCFILHLVSVTMKDYHNDELFVENIFPDSCLSLHQVEVDS